MTTFNEMIDKHYGFGGIIDKIDTGLKEAGKNINHLSVDDLAPIDEFHTRGRESTIELAQLTNIKSTDLLLDVGCGLGGTARHLAEKYQCQINGIDLTGEYVEVANQLTKRVGLQNHVRLFKASALEIPYENDAFDIAWTEHVQMNIPDKDLFYSEITRVLRPGGKLLFHDIFRGEGEQPIYPTPWAEDQSISHLATEPQAKQAIENSGMKIEKWIPKVQQSIDYFKTVAAKIEADGPPPIGIHLLMGDNAKIKLQNYVKNLTENRTAVIMGMASKK